MFDRQLINDLVIYIIGGIIGIIGVSTIPIWIITRYKLKVEKIKADAVVQSEEIRARNRFEIEKMMQEEEQGELRKSTYQAAVRDSDDILNEKRLKERA